MIHPFQHRSALPGILKAHGVRHVADVGCGAGEMTELLQASGARVTGVDRFGPVAVEEWPSRENRQESGWWKAREAEWRRRCPGAVLHKGDAAEAAAKCCGAKDGVDAVWLDADLSYRGTLRTLGAWADALPDGALLAGAGYVRSIARPHGELPTWVNVPDAIAEVRRSRPFLTEPLLTWGEACPSWLMWKRVRVPEVEILSAATPDTPWWPEVEAHHRRYAARHGCKYMGRTMAVPADRSPVWLKIALMRERLRESRAEWLFWLDGDAILWDFNRPLQGYVPAGAWDGLFPQFWRGRDCLSSGAFLLRNSEGARELTDKLWAEGKGGGYFSEEWALAGIAPGVRARLLLTDHRDLNSVPTGGIWHGGGRDFVMHAAFLREGRTAVLRDLIARAEGGTDWPGGEFPVQKVASAESAARPVPAPPAVPTVSVPPPPPLPHGFAA